jgi:exo-beta-1,3-glucanase (GH17 family)/cellulose synthase/poly-beta-1,6-N-acetylglucosamine synthase-like glycosyltransferase
MRSHVSINVAVVLAIAAATLVGWAAANQPRFEPQWPAAVHGFAYSPLQRGQVPSRGDQPSRAQIDADLALMAGTAGSIRTYSLDGIYSEIPGMAARHGLDVTLGVDLEGDRRSDEMRVARLGAVASESRSVQRAIIGNETLLTETLTIEDLTALIERARLDLPVAVSTAEPWHIWMQHPELASHVDFITVHLLPYWEGIAIDEAVDYVLSRMALLETTFPGKPIVIGEVGWPSHGRMRDNAVPSEAHAATFLRRFLERADARGYEYFLMEAFDQPWKRNMEGVVGAYWGVFDVDRAAKYDFVGPIESLPGWRTLAIVSALLAALVYCAMLVDGRRLRGPGRLFIACSAAVVATICVWSLAAYVPQYWSTLDVFGAVLLLIGMLGVVVLLLVELHEWAEAIWCARARKTLTAESAALAPLPKVSIHVPTYREPPALLAETLGALADLDYPDFEVIVVDNNTKDERLWRPVEALCASLGERFRFFHVEPLAGYKAGALNFALEKTAADASVVAVLDSDYKVDPSWLRDLVPHFAEEAVAIVQAPQDYRDGRTSLFKTTCDAEYQGFFRIGMVNRNDRNAIIQHGTMTMIRKRVLADVGGWDPSTITEDAELGLRVLDNGHEARYIPRSYGKGLTPDNFHDYKVQRFRWAFGAVQILRKHGARLVGRRPSALSWGQRYHFVAGWLPWLADGLSLIFSVVAIFWSLAIIFAPARFYPPLAVVSLFVIGFFAFKLLKMLVLYRWRVRASAWQTLGATVAGLGLAFTVGRAVLAGIAIRQMPFHRTPKLARRHSFTGALAAAAPEAVLATMLFGCATGVSATAPVGNIDTTLWCMLLTVFGVPYLSSVMLSLFSASPSAAAEQLSRPIEEMAGETRRG